VIGPETGGPQPGSFFGSRDALRDERQRRGESLEEIAGAIRIRERYLADLEDGAASFEPYPGRVYGRFFLREYAQYLGLDPAPLVRAFDVETEPEPTIAPPRPPASRRKATAWVLVGLISMVALLAVRAIPVGDGQGPRSLQAPAAQVPSPPRASHPHAPPHAGATRGIRVMATITSPCWIHAVADGQTIYRRTAPEGSTAVLRADRTLEITLGNAGGVSLEVNGRPVETGTGADVVHLSFAWRDGRLVRV
jgi:transcriptional regulator with XRE-family HTH domain